MDVPAHGFLRVTHSATVATKQFGAIIAIFDCLFAVVKLFLAKRHGLRRSSCAFTPRGEEKEEQREGREIYPFVVLVSRPRSPMPALFSLLLPPQACSKALLRFHVF